MEVHLVVLLVLVRSSDSRQTAVLHTHQKKGGGGAVTGSERRVMNCQLRLGLTRLYMTGQIHSRLPGREGGGQREHRGREEGGQGNVSGRKQDPNIWTSCVWAQPHVISQTRKLKPSEAEFN